MRSGATMVPAIAVRLSGLSERSFGNGMNRKSVTHWLCKEPVVAGRVKREANQFLCRVWRPWDISEHQGGAVTCPRCLELAARLAPEDEEREPLTRAEAREVEGDLRFHAMREEGLL